MASGSGNLLIYGVVGFFLGLGAFVLGFITLSKKQLISNVPTSKIRSIAMGLVEVYGDAIPENNGLFITPFSNRQCLYYNYKIQERRGSGKRAHWVTIRQETKINNFYIQDETGKVLLNPAGATVDVPFSFTYSSGLLNDPPAEVKNFLKNENLSFEGFLGINKTMKFEEKAIFPNQKLYVLGEAADNPNVAEGTSKQNVEDILIQKGKNEKFFYISTKSEKEILASMSIKSYLMIGGGILLVVGSIIAIMVSLKIF